MKSLLDNYKEYPIPFWSFIAFVINSLVGVVLVELFAKLIINSEVLSGGILDSVIQLVLVILVSAGVIAFTCVSLSCCLKIKRKIYRGIGITRLINIISFLCPVAMVGVFVFLKVGGYKINFFGVFAFLADFSLPFCLTIVFRHSTRRCNQCGLINTCTLEDFRTTSLGTKVKYHKEGGYYQDVRITGTAGGEYVSLSTSQYVPKTTVRDGEYETKESTSTYKCSVCNNIMTSSFRYEKKISP